MPYFVMTPNQLRAVTRIHQQEGIPKREAMRRVASQVAIANANAQKMMAQLPAIKIDLTVCRGGCPEHSTEPAESCWLGIAGRNNPNCLAGSEQLSRRRLGQLPPCDRQFAARSVVDESKAPASAQPSDMPPLLARLPYFAKAIKDFVSDGFAFVSREDYLERLSICAACPRVNGNWCSRCGCWLSAKAKGRIFECPEDRWPKQNLE